MEVVLASSSVDGGVGCWELDTGFEHIRYRSCSSPAHGLISVSDRFLAASQTLDSSSHGSILIWCWDKPQPEVKSYPVEPIRPLTSNHEGTYIIGGGVSGHIYIWEVTTGKLLRRWHGHYRALTCLVLSDDQSLLISGAEDGCVRVWSLFMIFDDERREQAKSLYEYSFTEHTLPVTDIVTGHGGNNAIVVSASDDRTCKVWSLSLGKLLRNIVFPSIIYAIALDPSEHVFYAGGKDGRIYIAALNTESICSSKFGKHIIGSLYDHSKSVSCLEFSEDGISLVSGSEDGMVRVWNTKTHSIVRIFKHSKGPINNVIVLKKSRTSNSTTQQVCIGKKRNRSLLPPPLERYVNSHDENIYIKTVITSEQTPRKASDASYISFHTMNNQIREFQAGCGATNEVENERLKVDCKKLMQMVEQWKKMYTNLHGFCVKELLDDSIEN